MKKRKDGGRGDRREERLEGGDHGLLRTIQLLF